MNVKIKAYSISKSQMSLLAEDMNRDAKEIYIKKLVERKLEFQKSLKNNKTRPVAYENPNMIALASVFLQKFLLRDTLCTCVASEKKIWFYHMVM